MKNAILRGTSRFRAHFRSAWRSLVAFAAFALTGGTLFAAPGPYEADTTGEPEQYEGYVLSWSDEFNGAGYPDPANWGYEKGYVRNGEAQEYTTSLDNAYMSDGSLKIVGRKESDGHYTSASLITKGLRHFKYGRYEFRAKVPISGGAWPVLWMMGVKYTWPACGEIDIMEYYSGLMHANWCWGNDGGSYNPWSGQSSNALWDFSIDNFTKGGRGFTADSDFFSEFHVWRMDWDESKCTIYIDGVKMNEQNLDAAINGEGYEPESAGKCPFREPQYILMDIAMGSGNGGTIDDSKLPMVMEVDYVRCYRLAGDEHKDEGMIVPAPIDMTPGEGSAYVPDTSAPTAPTGYHLAWNDEFDTGDTPSTDNWSMEAGSTEYVANGVLVMPLTNATGALTWGGLDSVAGRTFTKGIMEIRARLPMARGSTALLTTATADGADPYGYVEVLDFGWSAASPFIGGWVECPGVGDWFDIGLEVLRETNEKWEAQFHVWRYIVDDEAATITLDGRQLYRKSISQLSSIGKDALPHHLNFWTGTDGVSLSDPLIGHGLEIDYVRVYEPGEPENPPVEPEAANRFVMIGDSITAQSWQDGNRSPCSWGFSRLIEGKLPDDAEVVALGWSGQVLSGWKDTEIGSRGGTGNYGTELETGFFVGTELDKPADAIFVMLGMNDLLKPTTYDTTDSIAAWKANLKTFAQNLKAREAGKNATIYIASVTLLTEDLTGPKNAMLDKLAIAAQEVVSELGAGYAYVPVRENYKTFFNTCRQANPEFHGCFDFVHPTEGGHAVIAKSYLTALGKTTEAAAIQTSNIDPIIAHVIATAPTSYVPPNPAPWLVSDKAFSLQYAWNYPVLNDETAAGPIETAIEAGKTPTELLSIDASRLTGWTTYTSSVDYPGGATDASICYNQLFNAGPFSAAYAARYVYSPTARKVTLSVTKESFSECPYVAIWINGEKVHAGQTVSKEVDLKEGDNLVYVRSSQIEWFWQQSVAFGPSASCPDVSDLVYGTAPYVPVDPGEEDPGEGDSGVSATGATTTKVGDDDLFTFAADGMIKFTEAKTVEVLLVGGGAGGGCHGGGGGGAGGVIHLETLQIAAGEYPVTVGLGGLGSQDQNLPGGNGGVSSVFGYKAFGGGGGGSIYARSGVMGASGGGAAGTPGAQITVSNWQIGVPGAGMVGQGFTGGYASPTAFDSWHHDSAGGGGAGSVGGFAKGGVLGQGGDGVACAITGASVYYGGGGGGGVTGGGADVRGGLGGGGMGHGYDWAQELVGKENEMAVAGEDGANGLGGGGGGGGGYFHHHPAKGGNGGSGIVIVRVLASPASAGSEPTPNRPLPPSGSISASGSKGGYDGGGNHYITVNAGQEFTVEYRLPDETEWSATNPRFVNVCDTSVWYRVTSADYETVIGSAYVIITQADNRWTTAPAVADWMYGETPSMTFPWPLFGDGYTVSYSGTKDDGTSVSGEFTVTTQGDHTDDFPVRDPGNYKVGFTVAETDNWKGLSADFMLSIWNDATIKTADGFAFTKYLMGILDPNNNWKLVPFEDVTSLETALAKDKTGTWSETKTFGVVAGYIGETTGDFDYEHNGGTDGGFPGGRWQQEDHTLIEATATLVVTTPGKYTLALGMPAGCDFALTITHDAETFTMDTSDYDETTLRAVKTFDFAEAGEYALDLAQFRAEGADYLELSYAPGEVAPEDFSTSTFSLIGKTAMVPEEEPVVPEIDGYTLVWNDEFNTDGAPNAEKWNVTNPENAVCTGGALVLTADDESVLNDETYASLSVLGEPVFGPGHYEARVKSTCTDGFHSSITLTGTKGDYPGCGCYNFMDTEFAPYEQPGEGWMNDKVVAQWADWSAADGDWWNAKPISSFGDPQWESKFHVWTLDWTDESMTVAIDGEVIFVKPMSELSEQGYSPFADPENPFNLAVGFDRRDFVSRGELPQTMEVDYIRYYKPTGEDGDAFPQVDGVETTTADAFVAAVKSGSTVTLPEGGDFAWDGNVLKKGDETWVTLPDYYTVGEGGAISFAVDAVKPVISAIAADATVTVTVSNAKKGLTYGLLSATTLEGLATATPAWLEAPATDDGSLDIPAGDKGAAGFFKAVVTDAP